MSDHEGEVLTMGKNQKEATGKEETDDDTCPEKVGARISDVCVARGMFDEPLCWISLA